MSFSASWLADSRVATDMTWTTTRSWAWHIPPAAGKIRKTRAKKVNIAAILPVLSIKPH
jgi:hypothetical protein